MKNEELQCTYRSMINVVSLMIVIAFSAGALWATVELEDIKKYDDFVKKLCDRLQIKGYTRGGVSEYMIK